MRGNPFVKPSRLAVAAPAWESQTETMADEKGHTSTCFSHNRASAAAVAVKSNQVKSNQIRPNQITDAATDNRLGIWGPWLCGATIHVGCIVAPFLSLAYHGRNGSGSGGDRPGVTVLISGH